MAHDLCSREPLHLLRPCIPRPHTPRAVQHADPVILNTFHQPLIVGLLHRRRSRSEPRTAIVRCVDRWLCRRRQPIPLARHSLNKFPAIMASSQRSPQLENGLCNVPYIDVGALPHGIHQLILGYRLTLRQHQRRENLQRPLRELYFVLPFHELKRIERQCKPIEMPMLCHGAPKLLNSLD